MHPRLERESRDVSEWDAVEVPIFEWVETPHRTVVHQKSIDFLPG